MRFASFLQRRCGLSRQCRYSVVPFCNSSHVCGYLGFRVRVCVHRFPMRLACSRVLSFDESGWKLGTAEMLVGNATPRMQQDSLGNV